MKQLRGIPHWFWLPALIAFGVLLLPLAGMAFRVPWAELPAILSSEASREALVLSLRTCAVSTIWCILFGTPLALILARASEGHRPIWLTPLRAFILVPLVMPPVVSGLALLTTFGRRGVFGPSLAAFGINIPFTTLAVIIAQVFVSLPYLVMTVETAAKTAGSQLEHAARGLGASRWIQFSRITVPLLGPSIISGAALSFARSLGEFGATITFAGSMQGTTRTLPLEVYLQREQDTPSALALSVVLIVIALILTAATTVIEARNMRRFRAPKGFVPDAAGDFSSAQTTPGFPQARSQALETVSHELGEMTADEARQTASRRSDAVPHTAANTALNPRLASHRLQDLHAVSRTQAAATSSGLSQPATDSPRSNVSDPHISQALVASSHSGAGCTLHACVPERGVDYRLRVNPGQTLALIGPNGSGKSTGIRLLAGDITDPHSQVDAPKMIGFLDQSPQLFPHMSVLENIAFGPRCHGMSASAARERAQHELAAVGLSAYAHKAPWQLSGGQAQRVALARLLAVDPQLLLLDEPFAALDSASSATLRSLIAERTAGLTTVIVTHDLIDVVMLADQVAVLEDGACVDLGSMEHILTHPPTAFVARFAGVNMQVGRYDGQVLHTDNSQVRVDGMTEGVVDSPRAAAVFDPTAVTIRRELSAGSPRNVWAGQVRDVHTGPSGVEVSIDIGTDHVVRSVITTRAAADLSLHPGSNLFVEVKAMQVRIIPLSSERTPQ
ncbi:ABC transporter permease [Trueperella sp. LYQ143]|uniref:ABC transporter permease n=1 Tax=Trueperella sp. LYQ143 TaxID=3391059 RepID=UPI0039831662